MFLNAEELLNAPDDEEERREKSRRKRIQQICLALAIILLAGIIWWKWPVQVPVYAKGETAMIAYTEVDNSGLTVDSRFCNDESAIQQLLSVGKDVKFYKKLIQPFGAKSTNKTVREVWVFVSSQDETQPFVSLYCNEDGTIRINGNDEYTAGLVGDQGKSLYKQLYAFYKSTLNNDKWLSGNK